MASLEELGELQERVEVDLAAAESVESVDAIAAAALGQGSPVAEARRGLRDTDPDERRELGRAISEIAAIIESTIAQRRAVLAAAERAEMLAADRVDLTLPARKPRRGAPFPRHPL